MQLWNQLNEKFQALSVREKWLIAGGVFVSLIFTLQTLLIDPVLTVARAKSRQLETEKQQVQLQSSEIEILKLRLKANPDKEIDKKLQQLSERSLELSKQIAEVVDSLVTPQQMAVLLETVLNAGNKLKLESLESLPAEPVRPAKGSGTTEEDTSSETSVGYYVHPVRIELTGSYFDIKDYLKTLESMPVKYYWRSFNYQVEAYPKARLILEVYTLGTRQEFIGG